MREEKIIIYPMTYIELLSYEGLVQVNEHGYVKLKGQMPFEKKQECLAAGKRQTWVNIAAIAGDQEKSLFYGVITYMRMEVENETCTIQIELKTGSSLMDKEVSIRSFQNTSATYNDVLNTCNEAYSNHDCDKIMTEAKQKTIDQFLMQYKETDWNFIKRLASRVGTVVVPEYKTSGIKYYFGLPNRRDSIIEGTCEYSVSCDMQEYSIKKAKAMSLTQEDTITYMWEDREIYELGQNKSINGKTMYVWKIQTELRKNELYHTYFMKTKQGICMPLQHNKEITGASLYATVIDVEHERVQIQMEVDSNSNGSGACWFSFASVYSSDDGTGWYCMPEKGDRVRLHFPTYEEQDAYVVSAYHERNAKLRKDPEIKFWRNKEGKEIQLAPSHILMTNNDGTYIQLSDEDGIEIVSEGSVMLQAKKGMSITSSSGSIELSASKKVRLRQGETEMNLSGDLNMQGARIKL